MKDIPEELQQRISAYLDGQLPPAEAARLEVYLANTDPALVDLLVGMLADKVQVRALPKPTAPPDLAGRIMESVERTSLLKDVEHLSGTRRKWWQSRAAIAAGLALVLGGFSYLVVTSAVRSRTGPWNNLETSGPQIATGGEGMPTSGPQRRRIRSKSGRPPPGARGNRQSRPGTHPRDRIADRAGTGEIR